MTEYEQSLDRIHEVLGTRTQVQLADKFGIRQSSISDAKRRGSIPADWLLCMVEQYGVNPAWVRTGRGCKYLKPADGNPRTERIVHHDFSGIDIDEWYEEGRRRFGKNSKITVVNSIE